MAEYGFMVQTIVIKPDMEDATADELSRDMSVGLNKVVQGAQRGLSNLPGGGNAEILSHSITRMGANLVVSLLFRR